MVTGNDKQARKAVVWYAIFNFTLCQDFEKDSWGSHRQFLQGGLQDYLEGPDLGSRYFKVTGWL